MGSSGCGTSHSSHSSHSSHGEPQQHLRRNRRLRVRNPPPRSTGRVRGHRHQEPSPWWTGRRSCSSTGRWSGGPSTACCATTPTRPTAFSGRSCRHWLAEARTSVTGRAFCGGWARRGRWSRCGNGCGRPGGCGRCSPRWPSRPRPGAGSVRRRQRAGRPAARGASPGWTRQAQVFCLACLDGLSYAGDRRPARAHGQPCGRAIEPGPIGLARRLRSHSRPTPAGPKGCSHDEAQ